MQSKLATLGLLLVLGGVSRAEDSHAGHDHAETAKEAPAKGASAKETPAKAVPDARRPAAPQAIKAANPGEQCKPHKAAKADCFICDPKLRGKGRLWCKEHARYEDRCFLCHPEIKEAGRLYCEEHGLYEDECFLCRPELKKTGKTGVPGKGGAAPGAPAQPEKG